MGEEGESPFSKLGWSVATGVITSLLLVLLTPVVAGVVTDRLATPTCANPRGLVQVVPESASGGSLSDASGDYPPSNLLDGNTSTAWAEGAPGLGLGSSVTFSFPRAVDLQMLCVVNGYGKSWDRYGLNSRVRLAEVTVDNGNVDVMLEDAGTPDRPALFQRIAPPSGTTTRLTFTIRSAYAAQSAGGKAGFADTCLSEIEFWVSP